MSKILVASDCHLHRWHTFGYHSDTLLPKRLFDQQQVLSQITDIITKNKIKIFINGGDLFHSVGTIPVEALNIAHQFYNSLEQYKIMCFFVPGNHDMLKRDNPEWFHVSTNVFDRVPVIQNAGVKLKLIGFDEKINYDEVKGYDLVVIHQTPINAEVNNYKFTEGVNWRLLSLNNKLVFFGHIHQRAKLSDNCYIIGSPMHLTFGDTGTRGVYLIDTDDYSIDFIQLNYPEFRTVKSEAEIVDNYNYYRIVGATKKDDRDNVVSIVTPTVFEERIKSEEFEPILKEWLSLNGKEPSYLDLIRPLTTNKSNLGKNIFKGKVIRLHIKDFISIGEINFTFKDGFTAITGPNGNGKTAFVDAIFWVLFGETTKGLTGDDVIRRGQKDCQVILDLQDGNDYYLICRSRERGLSVFKSSVISSNRFEHELTEGLRQTDRQSVLETILGFDRTVFLSSCYFSQENLKTLTSLTDSEKTNMITNLLGFETYDDLYEDVSTKINENNLTVEDLNKNKSEINAETEKLKGKIEVLGNELISLNTWIEENRKKITDYEKKIFECTNSSSRIIIDYDSRLQKLKGVEAEINTRLGGIDVQMVSLGAELKDFEHEISGNEHDLKYNSVQIEELNREIVSLEGSKFGERCDKCGSVINHDNISIFVAEKNKEINDLSLKNKDIKHHLRLLNENRQRLDDQITSLKHEKDVLIRDRRSTQESWAEFIEKKAEQEKQVNTIKSTIANHQNMIKECQANNSNMEKRSEKLIEERDKFNDSILDLDDEFFKIDKDISKITNDILIFEFWKSAFSAKGIRSLLLDRFCNQFNSLVNEYLSISSNGAMSIVLNPIKVLKSGEDRNKLSLEIIMDCVKVKYDSLSGGEKRRVDVSLCLALNKWLADRHLLPNGLLGLIIFDEIFSFLDREGEENIGSLLFAEGQTKILLVISHTPELNAYANNTINIVKEKGVSKLI